MGRRIIIHGDDGNIYALDHDDLGQFKVDESSEDGQKLRAGFAGDKMEDYVKSAGEEPLCAMSRTAPLCSRVDAEPLCARADADAEAKGGGGEEPLCARAEADAEAKTGEGEEPLCARAEADAEAKTGEGEEPLCAMANAEGGEAPLCARGKADVYLDMSHFGDDD